MGAPIMGYSNPSISVKGVFIFVVKRWFSFTFEEKMEKVLFPKMQKECQVKI